MKKWSVRLGIIVIMCSFVLASCGGTKLVRSWKNKAYADYHLKSVLVVGIAEKPDDWRLFEDAFVKKFQERGVKAVAFSSVQTGNSVNRTKVRAAAAKQGCESLAIVKFIKVDVGEIDVEMVRLPESLDPGMEYNVLTLESRTMEYKTEKRRLIMQSAIYDTGTGKIVWRARTETPGKKTREASVEATADAVMKNLRQNGLIEPLPS